MRFAKATTIAVLIWATLLANQCPAETAPLASPKSQRVRQLIEKLGAKRYAERHRAERELHYLGHEAIDQLLQAQFSEFSEISLAAQHILSSLAINWTREDEHPITVQILRDFDNQPHDAKVARAEWLAKLEDGDGYRAVGRIARYEQSEIVAKQAALRLMENFDATLTDHVESLKQAIEPLDASDRQSVRWLRAFYQDVKDDSNSTEGNDPPSRLATWQKLAAEERKLVGTARSDEKISATITRRLAELAIEQNNEPVAKAAIDHLVELYQEQPGEIITLGRWLIDHDQTAIFEKSIWPKFEEWRKTEPLFVYLGAEAFGKTDGELSKKLANEAFELSELDATKEEVAVAFAQINIGIALENRGLTEWAIREYRRLIAYKEDHWRIVVLKEQAAVILSELLHDRGRDKEAADVLAAQMNEVPAIDVFGQDDESSGEELESRMHYFRSEQHRKESNREKQIESLLEAVAANPTDADVLIAMYRLPRADEKWKKQTKKYIADAVESFEANLTRFRAAGEIQNRANMARDLNQLAWLVGNTEGDQEKAVEYSRRSLELRPHSPGSLDTLGRTYFAIGDVENALKYQRRAVKLEPHSEQISRQLAEIQEASSQGFRKPTKP